MLLTTLEDTAVTIKIITTDVDKTVAKDHVQNLIGNNGIDAHVASDETPAPIIPSEDCIAMFFTRFAALRLFANELMPATFA